MSVKRIVPLLDRVLVQRVKPVEKTASGILIPESARESLPHAKVIGVGPGSRDESGKLVPCSVREGDSVLLPNYGGSAVKMGQEEFMLYKDSEILAKLEI